MRLKECNKRAYVINDINLFLKTVPLYLISTISGSLQSFKLGLSAYHLGPSVTGVSYRR